MKMIEKSNIETEKNLIPIKGFQKTSLIDYPPYTASIIFIGGCNFRCPYCHNHDLVLRSGEMPTINEEEIFDSIIDRKAWIDAVEITGGEPTLYPDLKRLVKRIKEMGLKVKLDTNGTNPNLVWDMLEEKLLDYIAMDIKAPLNKYENAVFVPVDIENIKRSISLIMNSGINYEFRSTVMPKLMTKESLIEIAEQISGAKKFVIQQFRINETQSVLDPLFFKGEISYSRQELHELKKLIEPYFGVVEVRE
jgi:pyruvate formate lyase activating enzyme